MKPISLKFKCFGPFMEEQFIDFDDLRNYGLFLITGSTGAGKTTILDAMCMALYGQSSGGRRGELADMRCKLAGPEDVTYVEYIFEVNDIRYKFYREVKMARKNLSENHNCMRFEAGEYIPMMANPKKTTVNEAAEKILQLTADQFRQIIILPQGQFEKLLVSSSAEKEAILTQVFHAERWGRIVDILKNKVKKESDDLKEMQNKRNSALENEGVQNADELQNKLNTLDEEIRSMQNEMTDANNKKNEIIELYEKALEENKDFEAAEKAQRTLDNLSAKEAWKKEEKEAVDKAKKADALRDIYAGKKKAAAKVIDAKIKFEQSSEKLEKAKKKETESKEQFEAHCKKAEAIENSKTKKTLMENARDTYESMAQKQSAYDRAVKAEKDAKAKVDRANIALEKAEENYKRSCELREKCINKLQEANRIYNRGAAVRLGKELLENGGACPVCGSTSHPHIAQLCEKDIEITDADLSRLNRELGVATGEVAEAEKAKAEKKKQSEEETQKYQEASKMVVSTKAEYDSAKQNLIEGIDSLEKLEANINMMNREIADYDQNLRELTKKKEEASKAVSVEDTNLKNAKQTLSEAEEEKKNIFLEWDKSFRKTDFTTEEEYENFLWEKTEIEQRNEAVIRYETDLANAQKDVAEEQKVLQGRVKPDLITMKAEKEKWDEIVGNLTKNLGQKESTQKQLLKLTNMVSDISKKINEKAEHVNKNEEFLNKLVPKSGVSFQRYVLGIMFGSVIDAANRLLENVQGGRYKLLRTDDTSKGTNQGGLELAAFDANNGHQRSVASLSGGEKFLVALSLAIGLSTVIQAESRGIRLEAMFIDEGFGSLDEKSIGEAVEVLSTVQSGHGLVGVISHVEKLRGILPYCIEVFQGEHGNYMK